MRSLFRLSLIVFVGILVSCTHGSAADEKLVAKTPNGGTITHSNLYENPTLGVSIPLEGSWQFFEKEDQKRMGVLTTPSSTANCVGPLCNEAFNVEIISKPSLLSPSGTIS